MATPVTSTVCSLCGQTLEREGDCLACLLRGGLDESEEEPLPSSSLVFGDFEVERRDDGSFWELGRGAMGVTYRARDRMLHREVALKVIEVPAKAEGAHATRERFLREARAAAALRHANVASVFQIGAPAETDRCYYAMELVEGETLATLVRRDGPLPVATALEIAIQVARALVAAAAHGLIHRDLKPANIMIAPNEAQPATLEAKVIDFGLAKATAEAADQMDLTHGEFVGTPTFASPEQFAGKAADARSDIYSLGVTLWYALTGEVPYPGKTIEEIRATQQEVALPVQHLSARRVPASVVKLLRRTLANDPAERPQSARAMLGALEACRSATRAVPRRRRVALFCGLLVLGILGLTTYLRHRPPEVAAVAPEKSIAVLPFENLSKDEEGVFFTDGVHEQVLTELARVADLEVINRTSVRQYTDPRERNLPEIARQLSVAHLMEGSVERVGGRVRIKARLTNARSTAQEWAKDYDRPVSDVFAIENEIAKTIATQLQAKLSAREQAAMEVAPTTDFAASALYQRALVLQDKYPYSQSGLESVRLLDEAIARDPQFAAAYDLLGVVHIVLYFGGYDHTPARRELARATIEKADRLQPGAGEVHLAWARYAYYCTEDYDRAGAELDLAQRTLPNNSEIYFTRAFIAQTQGRWTEALREAEHSVELDPRNRRHVSILAGIYEALRRYTEALPFLQRAVELPPFDNYTRMELALLPFYAQADTRPLRKELSAILAQDPNATENYRDLVYCALLERDQAAAARAVALVPNERLYPREWYAGLAARMSHNPEAARTAFTAARALVEKRLLAHPDYAEAWSLLGRIDAALGRNEDAVREGLRACELLPLSKNAWRGAELVTNRALIYAWIGVKDLALEQLALSARVPSGVSYGELKLDPQWDSLRGDPRFEKIVASLAPTSEDPRFQALLKEYPTEGGEKRTAEKSIAVLPFENRSADQANAYFADGIQDEILTRLAKIGDLKVISRTSTEKYRGRPINLKTVGEELGVTALLEGSVQKSGGKVRVTVQLIEARSDHPLWAESYDRSLDDIFTVQSEIAGQVASALYARLTPQESVALKSVPTRNQKAYDLFLRGEHFLRTGFANFRAPDVLTAIEFYQQAVTEDAQFALAYAQLSFAESFLYWVGADPPGDPPAQAARVHADKAAALAPDLLEAHLALAYCDFWGRLDYPSALEHLTRARALAPQSADVLAAFGLVYGRQLRFDDAIAAYQRAVQYDPGNSKLIDNLAYTYWSAGRFEMVPPTCERALVVDADNQGTVRRLARLYVVRYGDVERARRMLQAPDPRNKVLLAFISSLTRDYETAIRLIEQLPADSPAFAPADESRDELLGLYCFRAGQVDRARPLLESVRDRRRALLADKTLSSRRVSYVSIRLARLEATLGNGDAAVEIAERGAEVDAITRDRLQGTAYRNDLAEIYARAGRNDKAITLLAQQLKGPPVALDITPVMLRLDPRWDPLRNDPRFQALLKEYPVEGGEKVGKQ